MLRLRRYAERPTPFTAKFLSPHQANNAIHGCMARQYHANRAANGGCRRYRCGLCGTRPNTDARARRALDARSAVVCARRKIPTSIRSARGTLCESASRRCGAEYTRISSRVLREPDCRFFRKSRSSVTSASCRRRRRRSSSCAVSFAVAAKRFVRFVLELANPTVQHVRLDAECSRNLGGRFTTVSYAANSLDFKFTRKRAPLVSHGSPFCAASGYGLSRCPRNPNQSSVSTFRANARRRQSIAKPFITL